MPPIISIMDNSTVHYFLSDAHFGSGFGDESERVSQFVQFTDYIIGSPCSVTIVGDFFDFWIEYKNVFRSDYFKIVASLYNLTRSGIPVTIIRGNHDFMPYEFLKKNLGVKVISGHTKLSINGIKIYLCHGDDLRGDWKYRALHAFLRNPLAQKMYCSIHPTIGIGFAESMSRLSRRKSGKTGRYLNDDRQKWYHEKADSMLGSSGDRLFIMGHTHRANLSVLNNGIYANCGAWLDSPTLLQLKGSELSLMRFEPGNSPQCTEINSLTL